MGEVARERGALESSGCAAPLYAVDVLGVLRSIPIAIAVDFKTQVVAALAGHEFRRNREANGAMHPVELAESPSAHGACI